MPTEAEWKSAVRDLLDAAAAREEALMWDDAADAEVAWQSALIEAAALMASEDDTQ